MSGSVESKCGKTGNHEWEAVGVEFDSDHRFQMGAIEPAETRSKGKTIYYQCNKCGEIQVETMPAV
jgi:formylmethanofuran dehydrogenase subunit E